MKRIGLLVLGAHRSGTSALARMLNLLGADLPANLMSAQADNPTGFWESQDYASLNDELLAKFGLSWDSPLRIRWDLVDATLLSQYRDRIRELLHRDFEASKLFVLKDPRLCRLLPVWRSALEQFDVELKCILIVRHPLEVASSLTARNALPLQSALLLWLRHLVDAEYGTRGLNRLFVSYERVLHDWRSTMLRITDAFNIELPQSSANVATEIDVFLQRDLRHHTISEANENDNQSLSLIPAVRRAYGIASSAARGETTDVAKAFEEVRASLSDVDSIAEPMLSDISRLTLEITRLRADAIIVRQNVTEREGELTSLRAQAAAVREALTEHQTEHQLELTSLRAEAATVREALTERQIELTSLRAEAGNQLQALIERDGELTSLRAEAAGLRRTVAEHEYRLGELGGELVRLHESASWRFTAPLREVLRFSDRLRRALHPRRYRFKLHPALQLTSISAVEGLWQAQGPDPQFLLIPERGHYPTRWCELEIRMDHLDAAQRAALYVDRSGGFAEESAITLPRPKDGILRTVIELPRLTRALRLNPCDRPGRFKIKGAVIREIGRGKAKRLMARLTTEGPLSGQPWAYPDARGLDDLRVNPDTGGSALGQKAVLSSGAAAADCFDVKTLVRDRLKAEFAAFLVSGSNLVLPQPQVPLTSIVLVLYNQAELTYSCLCSIVAHATPDCEVVIIDNASTDHTAELLERVRGAVVVRNKENRFFPGGCNQALEHARGKYLLLLNNDAQLLPGSLHAALTVLSEDEGVGAVGGRIINLAGRLQEAGSILWSDGSTAGYGRGDVCDRPEYMFRRDVDYCSAAFLLTRTRLFQEMGGFDEVFSPGYYEETDFCVRLWKRGLRVVYEPRAAIMHFEFGSSDPLSVNALTARNRVIICSRHADYLAKREQPEAEAVIRARHAGCSRPRVLFIDDRIPHLDEGSGYPRANAIANAMARLGAAVTMFPAARSEEAWRRIYRDLRLEIEVMADASMASLSAFLRQRRGHYDTIFVSRPHNMRQLLQPLEDETLRGGSRLIYDAEAVFALRALEKTRVLGDGDLRTIAHELEEEFALAAKADQVVCVSEVERRHFVDRGIVPVSILGHSLELRPSANSFDARRDILFVGEVQSLDSPNGDSIVWFSRHVLPLIRTRLACENVRLVVAGRNTLHHLSALADDASVELVGGVDDLTLYYERARIFVAPTRFAAGISLKAYGAAARGVPIVATTLIATQLGWAEGEDLLAASAVDPEKFADQCVHLYSDKGLWSKVREKALDRVQRDCNPAQFEETLRTIIMQASGADRPGSGETSV